jgi:hypothetical protein
MLFKHGPEVLPAYSINHGVYFCKKMHVNTHPPTGRVNLKAVEVTTQNLIGSGMDPKTENNPYLGFVYTSFQERATKVGWQVVRIKWLLLIPGAGKHEGGWDSNLGFFPGAQRCDDGESGCVHLINEGLRMQFRHSNSRQAAQGGKMQQLRSSRVTCS